MTTDPTVATKLTTHERDLQQLGSDLAGWSGRYRSSRLTARCRSGTCTRPTGAGMSSVTILLDATFTRDGEETTRAWSCGWPPDDSGVPGLPELRPARASTT